ncbi:GNAT family N-acetyltransferase [Agromyces kandeliae]|uniref:GNAT family N-acetyltransferase n=1 Tax=Agromyces kandeliae TaxID=2666141 RepID=A0A6L5QWI8_9MICO|nr:GNAT family N-acetyltransferase [Agromyces kandeliae]MRX42222.1 GNAT family N-acetyltransferase [Agromyces kandeliae]
MSFEPRSIPVDPDAQAALSSKGLDYRLIDPSDLASLDGWIDADHRGFHHARPREVTRDYERRVMGERRLHGVFDSGVPDPIVPVATVSSWPTGLSVPGGRSVDGWAVSSVTVSPTHRRRGIARAMMEAELRAAKQAGAAVAMLTATEATIYGRYGYAPAARAATIEIDRRRARWIGPSAPGRVHFVEPASLRETAAAISRRAVARTPGEIDRWSGILDRMLGLVDPESDSSRALRAIRYDDEHGQPQGFAAFRVTREPNEPGWAEFDVLAAATDDAERALWRVLVEQDFVTGVRGRLRSVDEPIEWLLEDPRAVRVTEESDHLWVRIVDAAAALGARRYGAAGELVLDIADPLGYAAGRYTLLASADGRAVVHVPRSDGSTDGAGASGTSAAPKRERSRARAAGAEASGSRSAARAAEPRSLKLDVRDLASIYLGGVRPSVLARAGRITASSNGALDLADRMFASTRAPHLSIWF